MFSVPITIIFQHPEGPILLSSGVDIDRIVKVEEISLDKAPQNDIDFYHSCPHVPHTLLHLNDGRKLPVREYPSEIIVYLDAYRKLDEFFTIPRPERRPSEIGEPPFRLLQGGLSCDTSAASTPA